MRASKFFISGLFASFLLLCFSCDLSTSSGDSNPITPETPEYPDNSSNIDTPSITAPQYFWGTWQRMDNGKIYEINEAQVICDESAYNISSSENTMISVPTLGRFTKQSSSVMINNNIPYFRKGGTNLEYKMKLVGFEDNISRAVSSFDLSGYSVTAESETYDSYTSSAESDSEGNITLTAPVAGDVQIVKIKNDDSTLVVVPGIKVENNGSNMGTIPLSTAGQYSLKVTGTIPDGEKDDGYLYGNNYKSYPMTLTITNVSETDSETSGLSISPADSVLDIKSTDGTNLSLTTVSTLKSGMTKSVNLSIKCSTLSDAYIDTGIKIEIANLKTGKKWVDFVPLRFYKGQIPVTVAAKSTEKNTDAALNGFIIYPDGNHQFFSVPDNGSATRYVPSFGPSQKYLLSFSGATVEGELSKSTEMFYTVNPGSRDEYDVIIPNDLNSLMHHFNFGESNDTEMTAYCPNEKFCAYLSDGDIDFYEIVADSEEIILPGGTQICKVRYENKNGQTPDSVIMNENQKLTSSNLPILPDITGYIFDGWYMGGYKVHEGYTVKCNITLEANWKPTEYTIKYNLNGGTNNSENPEKYTIESDTINLRNPSRRGYDFMGWFSDSAFSNMVTSISKGSTGSKTFYAKWTAIHYSIKYNLNGGTLSGSYPTKYTIKEQVVLPIPDKINYVFCGWYTNSNFTGNSIEKIPIGSIGAKSFYAKWIYGIKFNANTDDINAVNLSNFSTPIEFYVYGKITDELIRSIANKIKECPSSVSLNLKNATGMTEFTVYGERDPIYTYRYYSVFYPCPNLKTILLPDCLDTIGNYAFNGCSHIENIVIPDSVKYLGSYVFYNCTNVKELNLPNLWKFGPYTFHNCIDKVVYDDSYSNWSVAYTDYNSNDITVKYISLFREYSEYENLWWVH